MLRIIRSRRIYAAPALMGLLASIVLVLGTRWGIGVSSDSVTYMTSVDPGVHAPLYAVLLWIVRNAGLNVLDASRWLNVALIVANALLIWGALYLSTGSQMSAFLGSFLVLTSIQFLDAHVFALSEPLFFLFVLLGLLTLTRYLDTGMVTQLVLAGIFTGLAVMTRYAGAALIATGILSIVFFAPAMWKRRTLLALSYFLISAFPMVLWMFVFGEDTGRKLALLGTDDMDRLYNGILELARFLLPTLVPTPIRLFCLLAVIVGLAVLVRRQRAVAKGVLNARVAQPLILNKLPHVAGIFIVMYLGLLIATILVQPYIILNDRILSPLYLVGILLAIPSFHNAFKTGHEPRSLFILVIGFTIVLASVNTARTAKWIAVHYNDAGGYASREWKLSPLIAYIRAIDTRIPVYSNGDDVIAFLTGRSVSHLPFKYDPITGKRAVSYTKNLRQMGRRLAGDHGVIVYFTNEIADWRWYLPSRSDLEKELPLQEKLTAPDGVIYSVGN